MRIKHTITTSWKSVIVNKSRSALTILGIVIGISSIIVIMSLGDGASDLITSEIEGIGSQTIAIEPGREPTSPTDVAQLFSDSLVLKDIEALKVKENVPGLKSIMPEVYGGVTGSYENETYRFTITGVTEIMQSILNVEMTDGIFMSADDVKQSATVAVLGSKVKDQLFGADDAIGKKIKVKGVNLRVIGVLSSKGSSLMSMDEMVLVPYTTAQTYILGTKHFNEIIVQADPSIPLEQTVSDIKTTLRISHNITDPEKDDFYVSTAADLLDRIGTVTTALTVLLASVAAISLIVGGIGIMNIMLVSVTERTREIGLRKAIGATETEILSQFLAEAVILTAIGGIIGVLFGAFVSFCFAWAINQFSTIDWTFIFPLRGAVLGIGVSSFIGLVFGIVPARRAAKKEPIEALRYE
ncbi:MAG: ABC transporter permease [Candidatus Pacebacteria bacterium]|jgi:putative ABC transport system permease protein|nr:ABC transporter permease [Candidatus Paceibacterota bacterium]